MTVSDAEKWKYDLTGLEVQASDSIQTQMNHQIQNRRSSVTPLRDVVTLLSSRFWESIEYDDDDDHESALFFRRSVPTV